MFMSPPPYATVCLPLVRVSVFAWVIVQPHATVFGILESSCNQSEHAPTEPKTFMGPLEFY